MGTLRESKMCIVVLVMTALVTTLLSLALNFSPSSVINWLPLQQLDLQAVFNQTFTNYQADMSERSRKNETAAPTSESKPTLDFEVTRRLVETNLRDAYFFFSNQLKQLYSSNTKMKPEDFKNLQKEGAERIRILQYDLRRLGQVGDEEGSWRQREAKELSEEIQQRLHRLQHPPDCATAKKLLCDLNAPCGFGCEIHHLIHCFMAAYEKNRTLILNSAGWRYSPKGWETVFQPFSETCTNFSAKNMTNWPGTNESQTVRFPDFYTMIPPPVNLPLAIPQDISERLIRLHGSPGVWWVGQFIKYFFKLHPYVKEMINNTQKAIQFQHPIVGVHVRRTNKYTEARFYNVDDYMEQAEEYFAGLEIFNPNVTRRIYLASEEPKVYEEVKLKYPHYKILYHQKKIDVVQMSTRRSLTSLRDLLVDIHFLTHSDYVILTFSSNFGRLVYEIMQTLHPDASDKFYSLDSTYFSYAQRPSFLKSRFHHHDRRTNLTIEQGKKLMSPSWSHDFRNDLYLPYKTSEKTVAIPYYKLENVVDVVNVDSP